MLIPHVVPSVWDTRLFSTYSAAEQTVLTVAKHMAREGRDPDWCTMVAYEGTDELHPLFMYTIVGTSRLEREPFATPLS
jgi:N-methylhydantoinase A/oxoprolinase/acetone carboxylase beta subunit